MACASDNSQLPVLLLGPLAASTVSKGLKAAYSGPKSGDVLQ
jgi:hypothetical protein